MQTATHVEIAPNDSTGARWISLDADLQPVDSGSKSHAWTRDTVLGIDWPTQDASPNTFTQTGAEKLASKAGNGLRLPTRTELLSIVDETRFGPAADPNLFPNIRSDWYRTSTPAAWSPAVRRWIVYFHHGDSGTVNRLNRARVRLVRSVSPSPR